MEQALNRCLWNESINWLIGSRQTYFFVTPPISLFFLQCMKTYILTANYTWRFLSNMFLKPSEDVTHWEERSQMCRNAFRANFFLKRLIELFLRKQKFPLMPKNNQKDKLSWCVFCTIKSKLWSWTNNHSKAFWPMKYRYVFFCFYITVNSS